MDEINRRDRALQRSIINCTACPRLVEWRKKIASEKTKRFADQEYWGKPVPSFGTCDAELLLVGLAPAAHGANRTGRMFTGDRSGDWLYEALHAFGFASQPHAEFSDDGLELINTRITAVGHCAPPQNKLLREEIQQCSSFLTQEIELCQNVKVYVALGNLAYKELAKLIRSLIPGKLPPFAHGLHVRLSDGRSLIASYHPSQQNTFTGRLTKPMFHEVFRTASFEIQKNLYISENV